jgi:glucokinase
VPAPVAPAGSPANAPAGGRSADPGTSSAVAPAVAPAVTPVYALGIDVGGTKIAAGLVEFPSGRVLARRTLPTHPHRGGYAVLADALAAAEELAAGGSGHTSPTAPTGPTAPIGQTGQTDQIGPTGQIDLIAPTGQIDLIAPTGQTGQIGPTGQAGQIGQTGQTGQTGHTGPTLPAISAIGVDVCELVDPHGCVTSSHTVAWAGLPVREAFSAIAPAVVEADVRAHALAEAHLGAGRGLATFVFVTVGTGISSCFVQHGVPHAGARGNALILASTPHTTTCTACGATLRPVLEEIAGGPGLVALYNQALAAHGPTGLPPAHRAEEVLAAAAAAASTETATISAARSAAAATAIHTAATALGVALGWLVNVLDPEAIVIGGGLGSASGPYWDAVVAATRAHIWSEVSRELPILPAALGPDAGLIGAALAAARTVDPALMPPPP